MISADLLKDVLRLKLRIGEEVIGMLPDSVRGRAVERKRSAIVAIREVLTEFLEESKQEPQGEDNLKTVEIQ